MVDKSFVSFSLERGSKPYLTPLHILPGLNGVLFYFLWCQRERHGFDFVVQILGHHLGLGSPGSLTWCPEDLVQEPLNKHRQSLEHRDKALSSPYCFPTHSQEPLAGCRVWLPLVLSPFNKFIEEIQCSGIFLKCDLKVLLTLGWAPHSCCHDLEAIQVRNSFSHSFG